MSQFSSPPLSPISSAQSVLRSSTSSPAGTDIPPTAKLIFSPSISLLPEILVREGIEKGAGDLIFTVVCTRAAEDIFDLQWVARELVVLSSSIALQCPSAWKEVLSHDSSTYYISKESADSHANSFETHMVKFKVSKMTQMTESAFIHHLSSLSLRVVFSTSSPDSSYTLYALEYPSISFTPLSSQASGMRSPFNVPTLDEWRRLWAAWDLVTMGMVPESMLHRKPIDLRHKILFYTGHIPTFLDMLMSKALEEPNTEPQRFTEIFERGIDPHVDDPDHVHSHSEVPTKDEDWPLFSEIVAFRDAVRARLARLYDDVEAGRRPPFTRSVARMLVLTHEHEGFHVETLLYMLIQDAGTGATLPPPGFSPPAWSALAAQWASVSLPPVPAVTLGPAELCLGHNDNESDDAELLHKELHEYGWDNESPRRVVNVKQFRIDWRPITNTGFYAFWKSHPEDVGVPKSWVITEGDVHVRTLFGLVPLEIAATWPVLAAYDDLEKYAQSKGGRIPTEHELRLFFDSYEVGHAGGSNTGFRNWHPTPATTGIPEQGGKGSNGGVWEWTSDLFDTHDGLAPTKHFVGYSTDFFDGKHQVVLGASYATIPRLADRRTVRNFYQHNYPYAWVGARVAYDI